MSLLCTSQVSIRSSCIMESDMPSDAEVAKSLQEFPSHLVDRAPYQPPLHRIALKRWSRQSQSHMPGD